MKKRHSILIVDDEPNILNSLRIAFEGAYQVFTAPSGEEGLVILRREEIAVILADQRMPGMTGAEFLRRALLPTKTSPGRSSRDISVMISTTV
jgi:CheY-like chemotaxis protein